MSKPLVQWQRYDPTNRLVMPWLTHPFLFVLETWDLKDKCVLEYGGGKSTLWWVDKAKRVVTVESDLSWYNEIQHDLYAMGVINNWYGIYAGVNDGEDDPVMRAAYTKAPAIYGTDIAAWFALPIDQALHFDLIIVDGILRFECIQQAVSILSGQTGGILIVDNWHQDGFISPESEALLSPFEAHVYPQPDHTDHNGNCWKTAYFKIPSA